MNDLVSIVMPSYNTGEYIAQSINSVLKQTYGNWELIIVDDCSTDNTDEEVKRFLSDKRIRYLKNERNSGAAISRNRAINSSNGKWIAFLDSDDLWMPEKLEKQIEFMEKKNHSFSYTEYEEIDDKGNKTGVLVSGPARISRAGMFRFCWPGCLTVMYDASKIGTVQITDIKKNNDYAMWLKICKNEECFLLHENLAQYRKGRAGSISSQKIIVLIKWHYKLFREAEGKSAVSSVFYTFQNLVCGLYKKVRYTRREC